MRDSLRSLAEEVVLVDEDAGVSRSVWPAGAHVLVVHAGKIVSDAWRDSDLGKRERTIATRRPLSGCVPPCVPPCVAGCVPCVSPVGAGPGTLVLESAAAVEQRYDREIASINCLPNRGEFRSASP
jgi:hypothetical protein